MFLVSLSVCLPVYETMYRPLHFAQQNTAWHSTHKSSFYVFASKFIICIYILPPVCVFCSNYYYYYLLPKMYDLIYKSLCTYSTFLIYLHARMCLQESIICGEMWRLQNRVNRYYFKSWMFVRLNVREYVYMCDYQSKWREGVRIYVLVRTAYNL